MPCQITLDDRQRELLLDLLSKERRTLAVESHRAEAFEARRMLQQRLETVEQLLERFQSATVQVAT
jgi:hypothetical protein